MKKILLISLFTSSLVFANDIIDFKDLSKAVEKLIDNQIYLEKKTVSLDVENKALKQSLDEMNGKITTLEKNDNTLNTNLLKLGLLFEDLKFTRTNIIAKRNDISDDTKRLIVIVKSGVIRKTPAILCGNRAKTTNYGTKLKYISKVGDWYLLEDNNYINQSITKEYKEGKKVHNDKSKETKKER